MAGSLAPVKGRAEWKVSSHIAAMVSRAHHGILEVISEKWQGTKPVHFLESVLSVEMAACVRKALSLVLTARPALGPHGGGVGIRRGVD